MAPVVPPLRLTVMTADPEAWATVKVAALMATVPADPVVPPEELEELEDELEEPELEDELELDVLEPLEPDELEPEELELTSEGLEVEALLPSLLHAASVAAQKRGTIHRIAIFMRFFFNTV